MRRLGRYLVAGAVGGLAAGAIAMDSSGAARTLVACEYVGEQENLPGNGGGDARRALPPRSRFAGSAQSLADGPPPGSGGFDFGGIPTSRSGFRLDDSGEGCTCTGTGDGRPDPFSTGGMLEERFETSGTLPVQGPEARSPNGSRWHQNVPSCRDVGQVGLPATFEWTLGLSSRILSDLRLEVCLDVRKCQEEEDALGVGMTVPIPDFADRFGPETPLRMRVVHHRGALVGETELGSSECACEDRTLPLRRLPALGPVHSGPPPWLPLDASDPADEVETAIAFQGRGCRTLVVGNPGDLAPLDFVTVQLRVPASTRVRVRAAADSAAICYVALPLPGQTD